MCTDAVSPSFQPSGAHHPSESHPHGCSCTFLTRRLFARPWSKSLNLSALVSTSEEWGKWSELLKRAVVRSECGGKRHFASVWHTGYTQVLEILVAVKAIILQRSKQIQGLLRVTQREMPDLRLKCNVWSWNDRPPHQFLACWPLWVGIPWLSPSVPWHLAPAPVSLSCLVTYLILTSPLPCSISFSKARLASCLES